MQLVAFLTNTFKVAFWSLAFLSNTFRVTFGSTKILPNPDRNSKPIPLMKRLSASRRSVELMSLALVAMLSASVHAAPPDLTAAGAIAALKTDTAASPLYSLTYNLGPTGLRGWMYLRRGSGTTYGQDGTMTDEDRQILVTVASAPANAVLAVDDLILGVGWGSGTDPLPMFTSDARKAFGAAITEAEKTENGGILARRGPHRCLGHPGRHGHLQRQRPLQLPEVGPHPY